MKTDNGPRFCICPHLRKNNLKHKGTSLYRYHRPQATASTIHSRLVNLQALAFEPPHRSKSFLSSKARSLVGHICECYGCPEPLIGVDKDRSFLQVLDWASSSIALQRPADTRSLILKFSIYNTRFLDMLTLLET